MEPLTTVVAKAATKETADSLKKESDGFLKAVYGEPAKAFGGLIADKINKRQHANLIKITVEAKRDLAQAGLTPKEVPLSIIHPALEAASLEEDPDLQAIWAALLANAADPRQASKVIPAFVPILKEMTPAAVKFLDTLLPAGSTDAPAGRTHIGGKLAEHVLLAAFVRAGLARRPELPHLTQGAWRDHAEELTRDSEDFRYVIDLLKRNGILMESFVPRLDLSPLFPAPGHAAGRREIEVKPVPVYSLTQLGVGFMQACRPPKAHGAQ